MSTPTPTPAEALAQALDDLYGLSAPPLFSEEEAIMRAVAVVQAAAQVGRLPKGVTAQFQLGEMEYKYKTLQAHVARLRAALERSHIPDAVCEDGACGVCQLIAATAPEGET